MKKRVLSVILICLFAFNYAGFCYAENLTDHEVKQLEYQVDENAQPLKGTLRGRVNYDEQGEHSDIFTGEMEEVREGAKLKMTVSSVISTGLNQVGDEFFAEVTDDFAVKKGGVVIPSGTVAHGTVTKIQNSKRLGRDGYINVKFDYLITPDNRKIPIEASMTTKRHPASETAKIVLEDTAYTVAGGIIGGLLAFKFLGLGAAVASKGTTVAGGAGVGAVVGLTASMVRKGKEILIAPGDEIKVKIAEEMELPVLTEESLRDKELVYDGLNVKITSYNLEKDPFGELNTITLTIDIENKTKKTFSTFDMALLSEYKTVYYASPFGHTDLWFKKIAPNSRAIGRLSFSVDNPKKKHWLVFYDNRTRQPIATFSIKNAERDLKKLSER
ncbi:MAG: hypothetical protein A2Y25_05980 [Candidatus Melainabacteria bacterium GWF2_37_15]|nr:MAG: hypothetical protein A2Y25_05980 [Candidatus Melainabacteria bacterium GWF2_37_15]